MRFGVTLAKCGVLLGLTTAKQLLALADAVEAAPLLDSVWLGDARFANQRLDAFTLLAALAGRTERVLLGTACMGSFALRDRREFAYEWASLDVLSNGRRRLSVCSGGGVGAAWVAETKTMEILPADRRRRMIENIDVLRNLWTRDNEPFAGRSSVSAALRWSRNRCRRRARSGSPPMPAGCPMASQMQVVPAWRSRVSDAWTMAG